MAIMASCMAAGKQVGSVAVAESLHVIHKQEAKRDWSWIGLLKPESPSQVEDTPLQQGHAS